MIFWLPLLSLGHPLLRILVKLSLLSWAYQKLLLESGRKLRFPHYPPTAFILLSTSSLRFHCCCGRRSTNCSVLQYSVLSPTLFLVVLIKISLNHPIHSYSDDTPLHFSTPLHRRPTLQEIKKSHRKATRRLTSDLYFFLNGKEQT